MRVSQRVAEEVKLMLNIIGHGLRNKGCTIVVLSDNEFYHSYEVHGPGGQLAILRVLWFPDNLDFQVELSPKVTVDSSETKSLIESLIERAFSRSVLFRTD